MDWSQSGILDGKFVWLKETDRLYYLSAGKEKEEEEEKEKPPVEDDIAVKPPESIYERYLFSEFCDNVGPFHVRYFVQKFQRKIKPECEVITLNDVKDIVMFTFADDIPPVFVDFFYTAAIDMFLRTLLLYFQYFLRIWFVVGERHNLRKNHLEHPNSKIHELRWRRQLSDLRYLLAREYSAIILGLQGTGRFHFRAYRCATNFDQMLFELLLRFSQRVVEVGLNERNNAVVNEELSRLFKVGGKKVNRKRKYLLDKLDIDILEFPFYCPYLQFKSPLIKELYRPKRHRLFKYLGLRKLVDQPIRRYFKYGKISANNQLQYFIGIELGLLCVEEHFSEANIVLGILGKVRSHYDPLLTFSDVAMKNEEDFMSVKARHRSVFITLTSDRHEADAAVAKRSFCLPYKTKRSFFVSPCFDAKKERLRLRDLWLTNCDSNCRLKYEEAGDKHDQTTHQEVATPANVLNLYYELEEMIKNNPYQDVMTLRLIEYIKRQMAIFIKKRNKERKKKNRKMRIPSDQSLCR